MGKVDFSPILKHTSVKPSFVPRLFPRTKLQHKMHLADAASGIRRLSDTVWLPDGVCQMPRLPDGHLPDGD